jgi:hypothetical protein
VPRRALENRTIRARVEDALKFWFGGDDKDQAGVAASEVVLSCESALGGGIARRSESRNLRPPRQGSLNRAAERSTDRLHIRMRVLKDLTRCHRRAAGANDGLPFE